MLPADIVQQCYAFDPLEPGESERLSQEAAELAEVMGFGKPADPVDIALGVWRINDTALEAFGLELPEAV